MRKVELNMIEQYKYEIIEKLIETDGNKNNVALILDVLEDQPFSFY